MRGAGQLSSCVAHGRYLLGGGGGATRGGNDGGSGAVAKRGDGGGDDMAERGWLWTDTVVVKANGFSTVNGALIDFIHAVSCRPRPDPRTVFGIVVELFVTSREKTVSSSSSSSSRV